MLDAKEFVLCEEWLFSKEMSIWMADMSTWYESNRTCMGRHTAARPHISDNSWSKDPKTDLWNGKDRIRIY